MSNNSSSVFIVVTTYNPKIDKFKESLYTYIEQVDLVIITDNSEDHIVTDELKNLEKIYKNLTVISMGGNKGIASSQNSGIEYGISKNFQWVIELDQDTILPSNYINEMMDFYIEKEKIYPLIAGIGPLALLGENRIHKNHTGKNILIEKTLSSGFMSRTKVYSEIGLKDSTLFIDYVDWEWCWRARSKGYVILLNKSVQIEHSLGEGFKKIFFLNVGICSPIRHYYQYRNTLLLIRKQYIPKKWKIERITIAIFKIFIYLIFYKNKKARLTYIYLGIKDGIYEVHGSFQNRKNKNEAQRFQ